MKNSNKKLTVSEVRKELEIPESVSDKRVEELLTTLRMLARIIIKSGRELAKQKDQKVQN